MYPYRLFTLLVLLLGFSSTQLSAQCTNMGSYDNPGCQEALRTYTATLLPCASGHCRYDFGAGTTNLVSRTATSATYRIPANPGSYSVMMVYAFDSVNNCTSWMDFTDRYAQFSPAVISGTIPGCPVVGQTYVYTAQCYPNNAFYGVQESNSWTVVGGTTVGSNFSVDGFGLRTDTLKVQWNAAGTRYLKLNRTGTGNTISGPAFCSKYDTIFAGGSQPPLLSGPSVLCGTTTADYSIPSLDPAFTYTWICSNGIVNSGQGTATANVTFSGNGSVSIVRTSISCGFSDTTSRNVTLSGSAAPAPSLPATAGLCNGQSLYLNPGTFSSYAWSNLYTTQSITATTAGTYTVTVTNAAGCQATATTTITNSGVPPSPSLNNTTACLGMPVTLNPGSFSSYLWSTGATTQTITVNTPGTYSVTVTNASGCTGTAASTVSYVTPPAPNITYTPTCVGDTVSLSTGAVGFHNWSNGSTSPIIIVSDPGPYSVTVTDANGCMGWDSSPIMFHALPTFTLGNDTLICADTTIILSGQAGMNTYVWSTGATTGSAIISTGGTYSLTVSDVNGCTAADTIVISGLTDCVFPGDANYDGVADNTDILAIGVNAGMTGTTRAGASTQWYGQSTPDWGGALPGNADPKHSDCDGNGVVDVQDTLAVSLNYLRTHNKNTGTSTGPELRPVPLQDSIRPGDTAWFSIQLGDANLQADSVHGLAFGIQHSQQGVAGSGWVGLDFNNCWFAGPTTRIHFSKNLPTNQTLDLAVTRSDRIDQFGFGEVCRIGILTDSNPPLPRQILQLSITSSTLVNSTLGEQPVLHAMGELVISSLSASLPEELVEPQVFPNPASRLVNISLPGRSEFEVQLHDIQGRQLIQQAGETGNAELDIAELPAGTYLLTIISTDNVYKRRLVVAN